MSKKIIPDYGQDIGKINHILSNNFLINKCFEDQNGVCMFDNCKRPIHAVVNAVGSWSGEHKFLGICEKHFEENIKVQHKNDSLLGITRP